jgi:UDP-N-acetylmuramoylalanine-D-glutamate ligase
MRVLVCGGRDFADRSLMARTLSRFKPRVPTDDDLAEHILILGGAKGADALAEEWADVFGVRKRIYPADWEAHGKAAGPIRNQRMLDEGKPDLVVAFPGGRGTADMVRRAKAAGVRVIEVDP